MLTDVDVAVAAAEAGAAVVRARYGGLLERIDKSPTDFATDADVESEKAIVHVLRTARPHDRVIGEELGAAGPHSASRSWSVDPLCGTVNFAAETPLVAVNVALRIGEDAGVAASADPIAAELFWTDGERAFVRRRGADALLVPSSQSRLVDLNVDPPYPNGDRFRAVRLLANDAFIHSFRPRVLSTTLALAWVAAGRRAAYITDGHLRDNVHFSAGVALCRASGCVVTGLRGEKLYSETGGLIAAADEDTHATLLALIDQQFRKPPA